METLKQSMNEAGIIRASDYHETRNRAEMQAERVERARDRLRHAQPIERRQAAAAVLEEVRKLGRLNKLEQEAKKNAIAQQGGRKG